MKTVAQTLIEAEKFYTISSRTGFVVEAVEGCTDGADVRLAAYAKKPNQEWSFERVGENTYRIRNRATGKLLDLMMAGTVNGTWLHQWEDVNSSTQMWIVERNREGSMKLLSQWASGKCMDTVGMGAPAGAILQIWQSAEGDDQLWTLNEVKVKRSVKKEKEEPAPAAPAKAVEEPVAEPVEERPVPVEPATKPASKKTAK